MRELEGKFVIVTGAARGLGRSYALAIAQEGASLLITDCDGEALTSVQAELSVIADETHSLCVNLLSDGARDAILNTAFEVSGHVDGLVNNAGVIYFGPALEETESEIRETIAVNVMAPILLGQGLARRWVERGEHGSIVNISSGAQMGMGTRATYCASKGAVSSLTYAWAIDLARTGIRVNAISPIATTRMWDDDPALDDVPFHDPDQVAPGVVYLLSDRAAWLNGQVLRLSNNSFTVVNRPSIVEPISYLDPGTPWTAESIDAALKGEYARYLAPTVT